MERILLDAVENLRLENKKDSLKSQRQKKEKKWECLKRSKRNKSSKIENRRNWKIKRIKVKWEINYRIQWCNETHNLQKNIMIDKNTLIS